jgi:hypothetical protein
MLVISISDNTNAQTQRNPVLEEVTGTWCQWCPCGHDIMRQIKASMPNAIMIGYHGPANGSDPYSFFPGNSIISTMGFSSYPTAVIDRTGLPLSRSVWAGVMNQRYAVPATVAITMDKSFNKVTGELIATVHVSALENLTGEFRMTMILLEDGLVYPQTGNSSCTGASDYVHNHVVRAVINGVTGEELNAGNPWNTGETISKDIQYTVPSAVVPDSCHLVVLIHKVSGALNSSEIQQGEEWTLVSPDYVATINSASPDVIADNTTPVQFSATLTNEGLLDDTYYINPVLDGPTGWIGEFTTVNGTFSFGDVDSVVVAVGESTNIDVTINPEGIDGFGETQLVFTSKNDPGITGYALLRNVTTTGVEILIIDASEEDYGTAVTNSLDNLSITSYGIVSSVALEAAGVDLSNFHMISWSAGIALPVFNQTEVTALQNYLDSGGNLFISGQDIGSDIFEANGQSQFAQSFYNNYLHASYVANAGPSFILKGIVGDIIGDGLLFVIGSPYDRSADVISPYDADASPIFEFLNNPEVSSIKVSTMANRIVYLGIGFEQVSDAVAQDSIIARSVRWLTANTVGVNNDVTKPLSYSLEQNYPNPFNPSTRITYSVLQEGPVSIKVFDMIGQEIVTLVNEVKKAGTYSVNFNALNLSSGVYIYQMKAGDFISAKKMSILK